MDAPRENKQSKIPKILNIIYNFIFSIINSDIWLEGKARLVA